MSWDLTSHSQIHAAYQLLLQALASAGTLVAVASKNDSALVEEAFRRKDILLHPKHVYPREVNWGSKSSSVAAILKTWNISADSVVFVTTVRWRSLKSNVPSRRSPRCTSHRRIRWPCAPCLRTYANTSESHSFQMRTQSVLPVFGQTPTFKTGQRRANRHRRNFCAEPDAQLWVEQNEDGPALRAFELVNKTNQFG